MKAVQIENYGSPEVLKINEIPIPNPITGHVLVDVYAGGINPFDKKLVLGDYKKNIPLNFPFTVGGDFSGIVRSVGEGVSGFRVGDEVYGSAIGLGAGSGAFAETLSVNSEKLAKKPKNISFEEASGLVLAGVSALQALTEHMPQIREQKLLVQGGAGGIGHLAVQLGKALGAHVSAVVGTEDVDYVKKLGATGVVDYKKQDFEKILAQYDAVFDTVGGKVTEKSMNVLRSGGTLVTMIGVPDEGIAKQKKITVVRQNTEVNSDRLNKLTKFVESGQVKVTIGKVFPLFDVKNAFKFLDDSSLRGKTVLKIRT